MLEAAHDRAAEVAMFINELNERVEVAFTPDHFVHLAVIYIQTVMHTHDDDKWRDEWKSLLERNVEVLERRAAED